MAEANTNAPLLHIDGLAVQFGKGPHAVRAVDGVSLRLEAGQVLGLVGESGSGKSVTCQSILRLLPEPPARYTAGRVLFEGVDLLTLPKRRLRALRGAAIAMVFQDPQNSLTPWHTVGRQVAEVLRQHRKLDRAAARKGALELLERVGIAAPDLRYDQYPHQLSGGMCQRVMIAIALACRPRLLIADEPTTALDVTVQAQILDLFRDLVRETGASLLLVTHDLGVVAGLADTVAVMYAGRVVEQARAVDLFARSAHPYTAALLAAVPRLDRPADRLQAIDGLPPRASALPTGCAFHPRCGYAQGPCGTVVPALAPAGAPLRPVACHHPLNIAEPRT